MKNMEVIWVLLHKPEYIYIILFILIILRILPHIMEMFIFHIYLHHVQRHFLKLFIYQSLCFWMFYVYWALYKYFMNRRTVMYNLCVYNRFLYV